MQKRIYNGPCPEVEVPVNSQLEDGTFSVVAAFGEVVEIPDDLVHGLDAGGDWLHEDGSLPEAAKPKEPAPAVETLSKKELLEAAESAGVEVPSRATKADIVELLEQHAGAGERDGDSGTGDGADPQASGDPDESTTA